jgi:tetratricopeptide (TPR) repeat protein
LWNKALVYAVAAGRASNVPTRAEYGGKAVELLERARAAGFFDSTGTRQILHQSHLLDALRHRVDFTQLRRRQWEKAVEDATKAIELNPKDAALRMSRANDYAEWNHWKEAAVDLEIAANLAGQDLQARTFHALALLGAADAAAYRKACARLLQDFGNKEEEDGPFSLIWTCSVAPQAVTDFAPLVALAEARAKKNAKSYLALRALGAVLYRAEKADAAVTRLNEAIGLQERSPSCWLFLAMAHRRAGRTEEAGKWLKKAEQWIDEARNGGKDKAGRATAPRWLQLPWTERLALEQLRQEAAGLVNGPSGKK